MNQYFSEPVDEAPHHETPGHWVERLFPPTFAGNATDVHKHVGVKPSHDHKDQTISPQDDDRLVNVFERVWLMENMKKHEREEAVTTEGTAPGSEEVESLSKTMESESVHSGNELWTSSEIDILRAAFRKCKEENVQLKVRLKHTSQELTQYKSSSARYRKELESTNDKLSTGIKCNQRFSIMCEKLKEDLNDACDKISQQEEVIKNYSTRCGEATKLINQLKLTLTKEVMERKALTSRLEKKQIDFLNECRFREENIKLGYDEDIAYLKTQIQNLEQELSEERDMHSRSTKALNHLRHHFSSLPASENIPQKLTAFDTASND